MTREQELEKFVRIIARFTMPKDMGRARDQDFEDNILTLRRVIEDARTLIRKGKAK